MIFGASYAKVGIADEYLYAFGIAQGGVYFLYEPCG